MFLWFICWSFTFTGVNFILIQLFVFLVTLGVLCGQCQGGRGVSVLSNHCTSCSDGSAVLIPVLSEHGLLPLCVSFYSLHSTSHLGGDGGHHTLAFGQTPPNLVPSTAILCSGSCVLSASAKLLPFTFHRWYHMLHSTFLSHLKVLANM